jgi:hypothetical protein
MIGWGFGLPWATDQRRWRSGGTGAVAVGIDDGAKAGPEDPKRQRPYQLEAENPDFGGVDGGVFADGFAIPVQDRHPFARPKRTASTTKTAKLSRQVITTVQTAA